MSSYYVKHKNILYESRNTNTKPKDCIAHQAETARSSLEQSHSNLHTQRLISTHNIAFKMSELRPNSQAQPYSDLLKTLNHSFNSKTSRNYGFENPSTLYGSDKKSNIVAFDSSLTTRVRCDLFENIFNSLFYDLCRLLQAPTINPLHIASQNVHHARPATGWRQISEKQD